MVGQEQSKVSQAGERERGDQSQQHRRGVHPDCGRSGPGPCLSGVRTLLLQVQAQAGLQELRGRQVSLQGQYLPGRERGQETKWGQ